MAPLIKSAGPLPYNTTGKILVRGANWIGDVIMGLPAVASIRRNFPKARITVLAKPWVAAVYRRSPSVDEVVVYERPGIHGGLLGIMRLALKLRRERYGLTFLLQNAFEAAFIARLAGIPRRAGFATDCRGLLLTDAAMRTKNVRRIHQTRYYLEMLNGLGLNPYEEPPAIEISERDSSTADEFLRRRGFDSPRVFAGIAPGAAFGPAKMWFPDRFAAVAQGLIDRLGVSILLFGSASDRPAAETIGKALSGTVVNLAGETTLDEAIALMARCSLFVSNDSGLMHLVAALGIPVVALFGSTDPAVTAPQGKRLRVIYKNPSCGPCLKKQCPGDFRCMKSISTEEVLAEAIDLFESADTND